MPLAWDQYEWLRAELGMAEDDTEPGAIPPLSPLVALMRELAQERPELKGPTRAPV